jgi:uncharacterized repeat protein (TIGR02543 family)
MDANNVNITGSPFSGTQLAGDTKTVNSGTVKIRLQTDGSITDYGFRVTHISEAAKTYTVAYNANSGIGAPEPQTKAEGVNLTLSTKKPTRTGHTFIGWATTSTATTAVYQSGESYANNASITQNPVRL